MGDVVVGGSYESFLQGAATSSVVRDESLMRVLLGTASGRPEPVDTTFDWRQAWILSRFGGMAESPPPVVIDANRAYAAARQSFERRQWSEALHYVSDALARHAGEWRYHFLRGLLHLGFEGGDLSLVHLPAAEQCFSVAAGLGRGVSPDDAGRALLCAARAAYLQGRIDAAVQSARAAVELEPDTADFRWQLARALVARGAWDEALEQLERAWATSPGHVVRTATDAAWDPVRGLLTRRAGAVLLRWSGESGPEVERLLVRYAHPLVADPLREHAQVRLAQLLAREPHAAGVWSWARFRCDQDEAVEQLEGLSRTTWQTRGRRVTVEVPVVRASAPPPVRGASTVAGALAAIRSSGAAPLPPPVAELPPSLRDAWQLVVADAQGAVLSQCVGIPAGTFVMGSGDREGSPHEWPRHEVTLGRPFWMMTTPVTQRLWVQLVGTNPSHFAGDDRPVEQVSWFDALAFCNALSARCGLPPAYRYEVVSGTPGAGDLRLRLTGVDWNGPGFRLPTEAEWEYACRAGSSGDRYGAVDDIAWHLSNSQQQTREVGRRLANAWGLHDMLGNVWEWVWDIYGPYGDRPQADPRGRPTGDKRVVRGGSWSIDAHRTRAARRIYHDPAGRLDNLGFRIVRTASASELVDPALRGGDPD